MSRVVGTASMLLTTFRLPRFAGEPAPVNLESAHIENAAWKAERLRKVGAEAHLRQALDDRAPLETAGGIAEQLGRLG